MTVQDAPPARGAVARRRSPWLRRAAGPLLLLAGAVAVAVGLPRSPLAALRGIGVGASFAAVLLFAGSLLIRGRDPTPVELLERGLRRTRVDGDRRERPARGLLVDSPLARYAARIVARVPWSRDHEARIQMQIDRAGWPLRASEFLGLQLLACGAGFAAGVALAGLLVGVVLAAAAPAALQAILTQRVRRRGTAFLSQLPDTLQLLAGSLQAGYAFPQAVDTLVRESAAPTSTEFARVLAEHRLGMALETSLAAMAERVGSDDFRWVVMAISIQRQVGGNLAALLRTVSETLRERERVRRQIKVLSAEGRLSAVILGVLPFAIAAYVSVANPGFLQTLIEEPVGRLMIGASLVLMGIGIAWMRKLIRINV